MPDRDGGATDDGSRPSCRDRHLVVGGDFQNFRHLSGTQRKEQGIGQRLVQRRIVGVADQLFRVAQVSITADNLEQISFYGSGQYNFDL